MEVRPCHGVMGQDRRDRVPVRDEGWDAVWDEVGWEAIVRERDRAARASAQHVAIACRMRLAFPATGRAVGSVARR